jgi:predicted ATPase/DNA-binding SARP family transcriptional activator
MLSILLLGPPQITLDGHPLDSLRRKNRALLYYLARRDQPFTRDEVLAFLWPDHPRPAAQRILRTMLSELRHQLGPALQAEAETLALAPESQVDTRRFESGLVAPTASAPFPRAAALAATLALYRGDFLHGFSLADPPEFDDWVAGQREHYQGLAIRGLAALAQLHEQQRNYAAGLEALIRALAFDPLQEDLQRAALRLHYRLGDRAAAIRRYETLRRLLDDELGVPPSPETRALYDALITDSLPEPAPPGASTLAPVSVPAPNPVSAPPLLPFTGRAPELQTLRQAADQGQLMLIEGEPGIGKTRLAEQFMAQPGQAARLVLRGAAHESEQGLPYQPMLDALRGLLALPDWPSLRNRPELAPGWLAEVARLLPELLDDAPAPAVSPASVEEARVWEGLSQFLRALARQHPMTLLLDDLHWADAATVGLLGYLARRAASPALVVLGTARPVAAESPLALLLQALAHEGRLARVALAALSAGDMRLVAERLSPAQADAARLAGWLANNAEGNPYFLTELVRFAQRAGLLRPDGTLDREALAAAPILPATVQNLIRSRLIRLSPEARRALEVAAVAGREFDFELVQAVAGQAETAALDALDELRAAGLIRPHAGRQYVFDHSLTMEVAYRDMGEPRFRVLHRRLAETLEALPPPRPDSAAGSIAYHFARAGLPQRAGPFAFRAGQRSAGLAAWVEAIAFYQQALQAEPADAERLAIHLALGESRFHSGDFAGATDDYHAAIRLAHARRDWNSLEAAYLALNVSLLPQARFAEAIALGRELRRSGPPELAVCAEFICAAALSVESAHPVEAEYHVREAERLLRQQAPAATRVSLAQIKYQLAGIVGQLGRAAEAAALYRQALDLTLQDERTLDLLRQIMLYNNLAYQLHLLGDPAAADYAQAGMKLAQERGSLTHLSYLLSTSGEIALARGDLDAAEKYFTDGLALARQVPITERIAGQTANLGLVARRRGQSALAEARLREALPLAESVGARHLSVRIQLWLAPLVPPDEGTALLLQARAVAEEAGYQGLLDEIARLEKASANL